MSKQLGWVTTTALLALLVWQVAAAEPLLPRTAAGLLLAVVSLLAGLRIGTNSANDYVKDLQRNNKVLADHQRELEEMNNVLLKQINSESAAPSRSN